MAFNITRKEQPDGSIEIYANDLLFAIVRKVAPAKAKGKYEWSFVFVQLPVTTYTVYKDAPAAVIVVENFINLLNRSL